ncbi:unnamed protein product [Amoebophrya sp. A120]|nr:unnamed protein product [Amoebophrya sp. A120]|eukprot:GSA120T00011658001.1
MGPPATKKRKTTATKSVADMAAAAPGEKSSENADYTTVKEESRTPSGKINATEDDEEERAGDDVAMADQEREDISITDSEVESLGDDDSESSDDDESPAGSSRKKQNAAQPAGGGLKGLATAFQRIFAKDESAEKKKPLVLGETDADETAGANKNAEAEANRLIDEAKTKKKTKKSARPLAEIEKKVEAEAVKKNQEKRLARQLKANESLEARGIHTKPDVVKDQTFERSLRSLATRGVVKLFTSMHRLQKQEDIVVVGNNKAKKAERALEYTQARQRKREERADRLLYREDL